MSSYKTPNGRSAGKEAIDVWSSVARTSERVDKQMKKEKQRKEEIERRNIAYNKALNNPKTQEKHGEHQAIKQKKSLDLDTSKAEFDRIFSELEKSLNGNVEENIKTMSKLKELSDRIAELTIQTKGTYSSRYDNLLEDLALTNPEYVIYINPLRFTAYDRLGSKIDRLDAEHLNKLQKILENTPEGNLFENKTKFRLCETYFKYFKNCLKKLKTIQDVKFYAAKYPEMLKEIKQHIKDLIKSKTPFFDESSLGKVLVAMLQKSLDNILFFTIDDIIIVAGIKPDIIGEAISEHPSIIKLLPSNFFKTYSYKTIFRDLNKGEIKELILKTFENDSSTLEKFDEDFKKWLGFYNKHDSDLKDESSPLTLG